MRLVQVAVLLMATSCAACHPGPVLGTGTKPTGVGGTIAGHVSTAETTVPVSARRVTAIDVATGERHEVSTSDTGGFTIQVPKGTYRLEVELRSGEVVSKQPPQTEVNVGDLDPGRDFEITRTVTNK